MQFVPKASTFNNIISIETVNDVCREPERIEKMLAMFDAHKIPIASLNFHIVQHCGGQHLVSLISTVTGPLKPIGTNPIQGYELDYDNCDPTEIHINFMVDMDYPAIAKGIVDTMYTKFMDTIKSIVGKNPDSVFANHTTYIAKDELTKNNEPGRIYRRLINEIEKVVSENGI